MGWAPPVGRPADYLPSGTGSVATCSVHWWTVPKGGDPRSDHAFKEQTHNSWAGIPKRTAYLTATCHRKEVLSNQRGLHQRKKGRRPKDPTARKGGGPRTLASWRHWRHWLEQVVAASAGTMWVDGCMRRHVRGTPRTSGQDRGEIFYQVLASSVCCGNLTPQKMRLYAECRDVGSMAVWGPPCL